MLQINQLLSQLVVGTLDLVGGCLAEWHTIPEILTDAENRLGWCLILACNGEGRESYLRSTDHTLHPRRIVMPKLTPSEFQQLHEIASAAATHIAKTTGFLSFVQDSDLRTMIENERRKAESHYNELIEIANGESIDRKFENMDGGLQGRPRGMASRAPSPVQPKVGQGFSDRTIASDLLDFSKTMAVRDIWAATEISHVGIRRALSEMARYHLDAAYELYRFMEQKGWYVPLGFSDNAERWFRQNHEQMLSAQYQDNDWANANQNLPS